LEHPLCRYTPVFEENPRMESVKTSREETEDGDWAVVDVDTNVQVGWCRHTEKVGL
jgi:hypothetical protein